MMKSAIATAILTTAVVAVPVLDPTYVVPSTDENFAAAIEPGGGCFDSLIQHTNNNDIVFVPKTPFTTTHLCNAALDSSTKPIAYTSHPGVCFVKDATSEEETYNFVSNNGGQYCPIVEGASCTTGTYCQGINNGSNATCPAGDTPTCPQSVVLTNTYGISLDNVKWQEANEGSCIDAYTPGETIGTYITFVFNTNPPNQSCQNALMDNNTPVYNIFEGTTCFKAEAGIIKPTTGANSTCPVPKGGQCTLNDYCQGIDSLNPQQNCKIPTGATVGTCPPDTPLVDYTNILKDGMDDKLTAATGPDGDCEDQIVQATTTLGTTVFAFSKNPTSSSCHAALTIGEENIYDESEDHCFELNDDNEVVYNDTAGAESCPLAHGTQCSTTQFCAPLTNATEQDATACPSDTKKCPTDPEPVDLSITYTIASTDADWKAAIATGGKCHQKVVQGASVAGTTNFVFTTNPPDTECVTSLTKQGEKIYTEHKTTTCFVETAGVIKASPGKSIVCPIPQGDVCTNADICAPFDTTAADKTCKINGTDSKGTCPKDTPVPPSVPKAALQTTFKCEDVCSVPFVPDTVFNTCWTKVVTSNKDRSAEYASKCDGKIVFYPQIVPTSKKRNGMIITQGFATEADANACKELYDGWLEAVESCLSDAGSNVEASYKVIALDERCGDLTTMTLLCKTTDGCDLACPDNTDCSSDSKVCGGECAKITDEKRQCVSAATQLVAGVVAVAALAVAFF